MNCEKFDVLGIKISAVNMRKACEIIEQIIQENKREYVCTCPVNTIMESRKSKEALKSINLAALATPDGMPIACIGKIKKGCDIAKVSGTDLMLEMCKLSQIHGYKSYFYGSTPEVLKNLEKNLLAKFPSLKMVGSYSPPFNSEFKSEDNEIIDIINKSSSDVIWVSLTSPKQDVWMHKHRARLNASVLIGVGAAFDFIAGTKKRAPCWMQNTGLEWLYRLLKEPKRLWKRYLINNLFFILLLLKQGLIGRSNK